MKHQNYQVTKKYASLTNELLDKHQLSPTPTNYAVFFIYINATNPILTEQVNLLESNNDVNDISIHELYEEHISQAAQLDKEILSPLNTTIGNMLGKLEQQVFSEEKAVDDLQKIDKALSKSVQKDVLKQIITYMQTTVNDSVEQHKGLSEELTKTNNEINQLKVKLNEAKEEAVSDSLTGFLNRRGYAQELSKIDIEETHTSLVIDIDHFKLVNDNFGHIIGDKVIQKVAQSIKSHLSDNDIAVRYGGEEFVVVAVNKTISEAKNIAERIRLAICKLKLKQRNSDKYLPQISVSIGIAETKSETHWQDVIERADKALYEAKNSGRNCIKIAE